MTTTTYDRALSAASGAYLAAVGAALEGVSDSDRQELLDDLAEHLAELANESDAALIERLGPPEQYAAELLASAGIVPAGTPREPKRLAERVRRLQAQLDGPRGRAALAFANELRPGWWVVRGWLVVAAIAARSGLQEALWIPNVTGKPIVDVALLAVAVFVSVKIGRGPKWAAWAATALGVLALFSVLGANRSYFYRDDYSQSSIAIPGVMTDPSGREIDNIFAYNAAGKPLGPVFLFDQNGFPLDVGNATALQANGVPYVSGRFPQPMLVTNNSGQTRGVQPRFPHVAVPQFGSSNPSATSVPVTTAVTVP
jgi:hypothetical protein